jgi:hypothetical protein
MRSDRSRLLDFAYLLWRSAWQRRDLRDGKRPVASPLAVAHQAVALMRRKVRGKAVLEVSS